LDFDNEKTLLILGGSLGARTINESILEGIDKLVDSQVQVIWQTGKAYYESVRRRKFRIKIYVEFACT
jgi:UDP-N-acetylglucosamine--N-acetylmuramyl-(pentapeptide) pyrophosphoryl-undecaprenol N-acetylglucosamine transferase